MQNKGARRIGWVIAVVAAVATPSCKKGESQKVESETPGSATTRAAAPALTKTELAEALRAQGAAPPTGMFQVEELTDVAVALSYLNDDGGTRQEVHALATRLVVATVAELKKRGRDPRSTEITAVVYVTAPQGVSGDSRAAPLGRARYDRDVDDVIFEAPPNAPFNPPPSGDPKLDAARIAMQRYTCQAFRAWQGRNPGACPKKLDELNQLARRGGSVDPWGSPYKMLCGEQLPAGARTECGGEMLPWPPLAVLSNGPDKKPDTADDVRSWE
jgi:hypothetical protein